HERLVGVADVAVRPLRQGHVPGERPLALDRRLLAHARTREVEVVGLRDVLDDDRVLARLQLRDLLPALRERDVERAVRACRADEARRGHGRGARGERRRGESGDEGDDDAGQFGSFESENRDTGTLGSAVVRVQGVAKSYGAATDGTLPNGVEAHTAAAGEETAYWLPAHGALVFGDVVLGADDGVRLCPESWLGGTLDQLKEELRPLLDLPVER